MFFCVLDADMAKRSKALIEAQERYEARREKKAVKIRLSPEDLARLDVARGEDSRAAYVEKATLEKLDSEG